MRLTSVDLAQLSLEGSRVRYLSEVDAIVMPGVTDLVVEGEVQHAEQHQTQTYGACNDSDITFQQWATVGLPMRQSIGGLQRDAGLLVLGTA